MLTSNGFLSSAAIGVPERGPFPPAENVIDLQTSGKQQLTLIN
jgi:hypothetical protein